MSDPKKVHRAFWWEEKGKPPRLVEIEDREDLAKLPPIPEATGARKKWMDATDRAQERKRKLWKRK